MNDLTPTVDIAGRMIKHLPTGGIGLQLGCRSFEAFQAVLHSQPKALTLVETWKANPNYEGRAFAEAADDETRAALKTGVTSFLDQAQNLDHQIIETLDDFTLVAGSLDFVVVDRPLHFHDAIDTIELALKLLKPGGVLMGLGMEWAAQCGHPIAAAIHDVMPRVTGDTEFMADGDLFLIRLCEDVTITPRQDKDSLLLISTMKNEGPYILEWIAHYRAIGVTDFLIYTNDCDDQTVPLLDRLTDRGIIKHEPNKVLRRGPHKSALKYAKDHVLTADSDWILICDVDEFLNLKDHDTLPAFLNDRHSETDAIPFAWKIFGSGDAVEFTDNWVTKDFTACEAEPADGGRTLREVKTIFRNKPAFDRFGLHRPRFENDFAENLVWKTADGADLSIVMNQSGASKVDWDRSSKSAYMNHYPLKSTEAYLVKKRRGRANHVRENLGLDYYERWNMCDAQDNSISRLAPAVQKEMDELLSDPITADLHAQSIQDFKTLIADLRKDRECKSLLKELKALKPKKVKPKMPSKRDLLRREVLEKLPKNSKGAEIGVWEGRFSSDILDVVQPTDLHLIDPWEYMPEFSNTGFGRQRNKDRMIQMYEMVTDKFKDDNRVHVHRGTSEDILGGMDDDSLDWVYIDGNHNEPFISNDLNLAHAKVRPGGVISGDDYYWNKEEGAPVKTAVDKFFKSLGDEAKFERKGQQYFIHLPE